MPPARHAGRGLLVTARTPNEPAPDWTDAACRSESWDPEMWWATARVGATDFEKLMARRDREIAVHVCGTCPLVQACGQYALDNDQREGIWGGLTPEHRTRMRRAQRRRKA